jgi:hypothetical protein
LDSVDDPNITPTDILHHGPDRSRLAWRYEKMNMVAHEHIGVNFAATTGRGVGQAFEIKAPIRIPKETCGAVVAALDNMLRYTGQFEPRRARHAPSTRVNAEGCASD